MSIADSPASSSPSASVRSPTDLRKRLDKLAHKRDDRVAQTQRLAKEFHELNRYLAVADQVTGALEQLSEQLFQQLLGVVEEKLSIALQEILDQPLKFRARAEFKRGAATVEFEIERDGHTEDVLRGQGGSVANILSVGLRMFALTTLDPDRHRRFLVLDEQDCWLRPDLVPKLVKIVREAGQALGFQVLLISHHDVAVFEHYADCIYRFTPQADGSVEVEKVESNAPQPDEEA
jgi:hypothetical protein